MIKNLSHEIENKKQYSDTTVFIPTYESSESYDGSGSTS